MTSPTVACYTDTCPAADMQHFEAVAPCPRPTIPNSHSRLVNQAEITQIQKASQTWQICQTSKSTNMGKAQTSVNFYALRKGLHRLQSPGAKRLTSSPSCPSSPSWPSSACFVFLFLGLLHTRHTTFAQADLEAAISGQGLATLACDLSTDLLDEVKLP